VNLDNDTDPMDSKIHSLQIEDVLQQFGWLTFKDNDFYWPPEEIQLKLDKCEKS